MAVSNSTVWEVQTGGSDTNGGGFVTGASGTDYSQQTSAQLNVTDGACTGNTTLTSATGGFTSAMIGNIVYLSSGPGWYEITAHTDTNTVTIDRNGPNASGMTLNVGGCLASPGGLTAVMNNVVGSGFTGQKAYIKAATYTLTTTTAYTSGGPLHLPNKAGVRVIGYTTTRDDYGATKPTIDAGAQTSVNLVTLLNSTGGSIYNQSVEWIKADGQSNASVNGFTCGGQPYNASIDRCEAVDCVDGFDDCHGSRNLATGCTNGFDGGRLASCIADTCSVGFIVDTNWASSHCIALDCTSDGFRIVRGNVDHSTAHGCTGDGFDLAYSVNGSTVTNSLATDCGGYGFNEGYACRVISSASYNCTSGHTAGLGLVIDHTELTADPFTDSASEDFSLNNDAGGGAAARIAGGIIPGQTQTDYAGAVGFAGGGGGGGATFHPLAEG